jgi:hypothetical protein
MTSAANSAMPRGIFLVGCPRSGTTLLQSLIAAHPLVTSFSESNFFGSSFRKLPKCSIYYAISDPAQRISGFLRENGESTERYADVLERLAETVRYYPPAATTAAVQFVGLLDRLAKDRARAIWLEKSPVHLWFLPLIEKAARRVNLAIRVVHIVRDGRDVVASLHGASKHWNPGGGCSLQQCIARWNDDVFATLRRAKTSVDDVVVVYEDLVADPVHTLALVFAKLAMPRDDSVLTRYRDAAHQIGAAAGAIHPNLLGPIQARSTFKDSLDEDQQREVMSQLNLGALATLRREYAVTAEKKGQ